MYSTLSGNLNCMGNKQELTGRMVYQRVQKRGAYIITSQHISHLIPGTSKNQTQDNDTPTSSKSPWQLPHTPADQNVPSLPLSLSLSLSASLVGVEVKV